MQLYKGYMEYSLRAKWNRPEDLPDENYVAEIAVNVDKQGNISQPRWLKGSGDEKWGPERQKCFQGGVHHQSPSAHEFSARRDHPL